MPPIKNFILVHPALVEGSITYQPQVPSGDEQLLKVKKIKNNIKIRNIIKSVV